MIDPFDKFSTIITMLSESLGEQEARRIHSELLINGEISWLAFSQMICNVKKGIEKRQTIEEILKAFTKLGIARYDIDKERLCREILKVFSNQGKEEAEKKYFFDEALKTLYGLGILKKCEGKRLYGIFTGGANYLSLADNTMSFGFERKYSAALAALFIPKLKYYREMSNGEPVNFMVFNTEKKSWLEIQNKIAPTTKKY